MKKKIDLTLIDKEIKKMLILNEYSYHHSSLTEEDDEDVEPEPEIEDVDIPDDTENDLEVTDEPTIEDVPNSDEFNDLPQEIGGGDVEEVDITDLKNDIDIIKQNIQNNDKFTDSITQALDKLNYIENKLGEIDNLNNKIDSLETEIEERNPTPIEKLELSSLYSFPYNTKISGYFEDLNNDSRQNYDVNVNKVSDNEEKQVQYELTDDDVKNGYNEYEIRKSF